MIEPYEKCLWGGSAKGRKCMRRFFIEGSCQVGDQLTLKETDSKHFAHVLRGRVGDELEIVCDGRVFVALVIEVQRTVTVRLLRQVEEYSEAPLELYLLQGIAKGERMDLVIQKAVELGVKAIIPVMFSRCVVRLTGEKALEKQKRWQKIAESAAKQCGRQQVPEILPVAAPAEALDCLPPGASLILPWEEAEEKTLGSVLSAEAPAVAAVMIGPEGGLTREEVARARARGAQVVTLGRRILRTETAAISVVAIVMHRWGDLG